MPAHVRGEPAAGGDLAAEMVAGADARVADERRATARSAETAGRTATAGRRAANAGDAAPRRESRARLAMAAESDYEAYRYALWRGRVTFHDVAGAWFHMSDPTLTDAQREPFKQLFPGLLDAFAEPRGGIITAYFCRHIRVAAALTDIDSAARASEGVPTASPGRPPAEAGLAAAPEPVPGAEPMRGPVDRDAGAPGNRDAAPRAGAGELARTEDASEHPREDARARVTSERPQDERPDRRAAGPLAAIGGTRSRRRRWWRQSPAPAGDRDGERGAAPRGQTALRPFRANPASSSAIHIEPTFGDPADWQAKALLFRCLHLHYRALEFLTPQPRKICMRLVFGVITALLGTLDSRRAGRDDGAPEEPIELETLEREIAEAERYYEAAAQRQAQLEYFVGMLMALATAGAVVAVLAVAGVNPLGHPLGVSLIAGGIGGVLSVMTRMTSGSLHLRAEAGEWAIRALGGIRPIVGAAFGAALYLLLAGRVISVFQPPSSGDKTLFYAGIAFLAGFSERFAQDAIAGATASVSPPPSNKPAVTRR